MKKEQDGGADLLARCALGDRTAFVALYRSTAPKLFGIALRILNNRAFAEEALQEGYLKIWRHAASFDPNKGKALVWMINIIRNQALDQRRRTEYRAPAAEPIELQADYGRPLADTEVSTELARLLRCMEGLSEAQRRCILAVYYAGLTPSEAARAMNLPLGTVKTWLRRGLLAIRECLRR